MEAMRVLPAELSITVCPVDFADMGPPSTRYLIGMAEGSQVIILASVPKVLLPTKSGPPAQVANNTQNHK